MDRVFPVVTWGDEQVTFRPVETGRSVSGAIGAALVFAFYEMRLVLADIQGRGWCVPGGRLEPGEAASTAARREAWEECGAALGPLLPLGYTVALLLDNTERTLAVSYAATVIRLDAIPPESESRGIRLAAPEDLPGCYYRWDELMAAMFDCAWEHRHTLAAETCAGSSVFPLDC